MITHRILSLVVAIVLIASIHALAGDAKIVANASVRANSITLDELRSVFLQDRRSLSDGSHVEPVFAKGGPVHEAFLRQYVGKSDEDLRTYYRTLVFTGTGTMPKVLDSDAEIIRYVARTKGAIGYVSDDSPTPGVKVLALTQHGANLDRLLLTRVEPEYPETLLRLQIGGTVRMMVTISPRGNVESVQLLGGNPILAEPAIKAAKQWVYSAGPSRTLQQVSIPFVPR